jgi:hypothetical protein
MKFTLCLTLYIHCTILTFAQYDPLFHELDALIERKKDFDDVKEKRIDRLNSAYRQVLVNSEDNEKVFALLQQLSDEYNTYVYDSAFSYTRKLQVVARRLNDPVKITSAKNQLGFVLLSAGLFKETLDSLKDLKMKGMPDSIRTDYYSILARAYYDLGDFDKDKYYTPQYTAFGNRYIDSAISLCKPNSYRLIYLRGLKNIKNENLDLAYRDLNNLLENFKLNDHQIAVTASTLSSYHISRHESEKAIALLCRAAIADIRSATKETSAMSTLAELLYKQGDVLNAYNYIRQAMDDAVFYGARQRKAHVGSILPIIVAAKLNNVEGQRRVWLIYSAVITVLSVLVIVFATMIFKELKKRKLAERALQEANKIKEEYIGYYFNINSEYLGKIETFKRSIEMKLLTKKLEDIKSIVNGINLKKERDELYTSFDKVFLKLFPDFVSVFNSFFKDEDKIVLKEGQLLNTELRIFALIRMGIHDTEKIARILDYSLSTIYNYKTRIKSKSLVPNEEFEKKIMEIHAL